MIELKTSKTRSEEDRSRLRETVGKIIDSVIKNGDKALKVDLTAAKGSLSEYLPMR